jgi:hypothetical protein
MVNGPEDLQVGCSADEWDSIVWAGPEREVERLRQRIFKASREEDWPRVRNLQKLMLRSRANTLVSVRRVAQRNAGRGTAGIDGEVALTSQARADVAVRVHQSIGSWQPARSSACTYRNQEIAQNCARSEFLCSWIAAIRLGSATRWSLSGKPGSSPVHTGSGRVAVARTRSG